MAKIEHKNLKTGKPLRRGAKPTSRHKLCASAPHVIRGTTPPQVITVPPFLEMWLNDQDGDCVSAEECFAIADFSVANGLPETKITDATLLAFCNQFGFLNGANLTDVMDAMINTGMTQDGTTYHDGPYNSVDYSNEAVLQNAIANGPVKIGIDADALPSTAGNGNGWSAFGGSPGQFTSEDHCVGIPGYGPAAALFAALGVPVPAGAPSGILYMLYTWSSIGVVDHAWIMSTCGEAWLRTPTTVGVGPAPIPPGPSPVPPGPSPVPPSGGTVTIPPSTITITIPGGTYPVVSAGKLTAIPWAAIIAEIEALVQLYGPAAITYIEQFLATLSLPPWVLPILDGIIAFLFTLIPSPAPAKLSSARCGCRHDH